MRDIHLHGRLARFGAFHRLEVDTAGEALRALHVNLDGFLDALREGSYEIVRGDVETGMRLDLDDLNAFRLGAADLHIVPVVEGSKSSGGTAKILIGVALVGAAIFFAPAGAGLLGANLGAAVGTGLFSGITYGSIAMIGLGLTIAGVASMIGMPKEEKTKDDSSFTLSGPGNAYEQGNPVPLVYGEVVTGGVLISSAVDIEDMRSGSNRNGQGSLT